jgi:hypothetical protein
MIVNFATQTYKSPSTPLSAQRAVNCFAEAQPKDAKSSVVLYGCPGIEEFTTCGDGPVRGMHVMDGVLYVVSGQRLYSVSELGVATDIGGDITGSDIVVMDDNGSELVIVNGTNGYLYSTTLGFVLISDTDFNAANTVTFFDQRFVFDWKNTNKFFSSDALAGSSFTATAFASAETRPDDVLAVILNKQVLLVCGSDSIEPWQDVGAANFPFERVPGAVIERGIASAHAICKADNSAFFMGDDRIFYRLDGLSLTRVSTFALEHLWEAHLDLRELFCFSYTWMGHKFVVVTFPISGVTYEFDIATGLWHERESWDENNRSLGRWRINCEVSAYNKQLMGDSISGKIGYLHHHVHTEFGNVMQMLAVSPPIHSDRKRVFIPRFEMDIESGVGEETGQGSDPQVMLRYSKDGGKTWSARQLWRTMGAAGAYNTRMRWLNLGNAREWVFEITISDPVIRSVIAAHADITVGAA